MKNLLVLLALIIGFASEGKSDTKKTGEHKSTTSTNISYEQEQELLQDYFPKEFNIEEMEQLSVQIYNSNFNLVIEGTIDPSSEVQNEELRKHLQNSGFLMNINNKSIYILEE